MGKQNVQAEKVYCKNVFYNVCINVLYIFLVNLLQFSLFWMMFEDMLKNTHVVQSPDSKVFFNRKIHLIT